MATVYSLVCWGGLTGKTVSISATTDVVTLTNHGLRNGTKLWPSGTLPSELNTSTPVYARSTGANTFTLHTSEAGAIANTGQILFAGSSTYAAVVLKSDLVASPSTALSAYGLSDLSRWWISGSNYRIYNGLAAFNTARSSASNIFDTEVCELGESFTETNAGNVTFAFNAASMVIRPTINDIKTPAFHNGVLGAGYISLDYSCTFRRSNTVIEGFTRIQASFPYETIVLDTTADNVVRNMILWQKSASSSSPNLNVSAAGSRIENNIILRGGIGISHGNYQGGCYFVNNLVVGCTYGYYAGGTDNSFWYNNIALNNSTADYYNYNSTVLGAAGNGGGSGSTPFDTIGSTSFTVATSDFANWDTSSYYANCDFRLVGSSTPIDKGVRYFNDYSGSFGRDILGNERPSYNNGSPEYADAGPFEYDRGYGPHPSTDYRGLAFTGLLAGSKVKVFQTGTDTEKFSTASSGTSETWSESVSGSLTVDYVILKAGYIPIRVVGVTVTAGPYGVQSVPVSQVVARWYQASSGLTLNTNVFANAATKKFGLTTASTVQNLASYLMEQWVTLGDSGEAYANKPFPIEANGPNSFTWLDGWEADTSTYPNTIANLSRDGMRYLDSSGVMTASWCALLSAGVPSGLQVRYQQVEGAAPSNAATTGNIDQLIQIYGDSTHGNFDYRGYMVAKVQAEGYDQAEVDVVSQYGTLEDQLYVIALIPTDNGVVADNPTVNVTITDHGGSPVTWNSKAFSITITDNATATGEDLMQWVRHALAAGGTFQGKNAFNWHDLVQKNGAKFKGVRGQLWGDTGATLKGVRVLRGTDPHPDFTIHTADDGSTVDTTPPEAAAVLISGIVPGSRIQVFNVTTNTEMVNQINSGSTYTASYTNGTGYSAGDVVRVRLTYCSGTTAKIPVEYTTIAASSGWSVLASQVNDDVYIANGIDGSTVTEYSSDYVNVQIDISDPDNTTTIQRGYAWYCDQMTGDDGIRYFFGAFQAEDAFNYLLNTDVANIKIQNTGTAGVTLTGGALRRKDGSSPIADGGSVYMYYGRAYSDVVTVSGSNVITGDIADVAPAVWNQNLGSRSAAAHIKAMAATLVGETSGAGTPNITFTDGTVSVSATVPLPGEVGDRENVTISGV